MPYPNNTDLPTPIRKALPRHAQDIYRAAFNDAYVRYGASREAVAHRIAWSAVKKQYVHVSGGVWIPRTSHAS